MPRPRRTPAPEPVVEPPNSLIASAANVRTRPSAKPRATGSGSEWQSDVWTYFDIVGELRFGVNWIANAMSRVTLHVKQDNEAGEQDTVETGAPAEALDALFGGEAGQSQMMSAFGLHLSLPGEAWLIGEPGAENEIGVPGPDTWLVVSNEELTSTGKGEQTKYYLDRGNGKRLLSPDALIVRIWRPHPRVWVQADSSVRAVLPILREIEQLTKHVAASIDSRLAGAGIFLVPSEMTFSSPAGEVPEDTDPTIDPFIAALTEAMLTPIEDRGNASAVVPVVVKAPGALIGDAKHITFSTPLDEKALDLRAEAIRRLALGLDIPPEVVLGQGDSNHWSAWQIEESALKVHIEPMCELICAALTEEFLRPALTGSGYTGDVETLHVSFSTEDLRLRPDRSAQAVELYDRIELSGATLRRETGFDEEDAPTPEDIRAILLRKVAVGAMTPEAAAAAAAALGVDVPAGEAPAPAPPEAPAPVEEPPQNNRDIPQAAALQAAGEVLVLRALERANNRLNRRGKTRRPFTKEQCDLALADAWDHAHRTATQLGIDPDWFTSELDRYTRALLTSGTEHTPGVLARCWSRAS